MTVFPGSRLRPYVPTDRAACLALFDANTPASFLPRERPDFEAWLDRRDSPVEQFVVEEGGAVVACGGLWLGGSPQRPAGFAWGMVHPDRQRRGLGSLLTRARLERLRELGAREVHLDTSQHTAPFYARHGFREMLRTSDGYGPGLDRVDMVARLA